MYSWCRDIMALQMQPPNDESLCSSATLRKQPNLEAAVGRPNGLGPLHLTSMLLLSIHDPLQRYS